MLRPCTISDEPIWTQLNKEFMHFEYEDENLWEDPLSKGDPGVIFRTILEDSHSASRLFLVEEENQVIGFMNTFTFTSIWLYGKVLFLDDFYISAAFRKKGYGQKALHDLETLIKPEGYKGIQLLAEKTNPNAVAFYEKEGFCQQDLYFSCKYI